MRSLAIAVTLTLLIPAKARAEDAPEADVPAALENPDAALKSAVFTRWQNSDSIRTDRYHYTEWRNPAGVVVARMLYDHGDDPGELKNLAEDPAHAVTVAELASSLARHIEGIH